MTQYSAQRPIAKTFPGSYLEGGPRKSTDHRIILDSSKQLAIVSAIVVALISFFLIFLRWWRRRLVAVQVLISLPETFAMLCALFM